MTSAVGAGVYHFFELGRDRIEAVKNPLGHQPARFRRVALKAIKLIGGTFLFWSRRIFHRIGRTMAIARAAQNAAAAALLKSFGIEPFFDSFEPEQVFVVVFHGIEDLPKLVKVLTIARQ